MANQWFRMYAEFATDPKVQMMSEADQRRFVMVLCLRCSNDDVTLQDEEIAFQLRISNEDWAQTKARFIAKGLINDDNKPTAWDRRQFVSDSSAERVRKHRDKKKQAAKRVCNVTATPPEADTDTEADTEVHQAAAASPPACAHEQPSVAAAAEPGDPIHVRACELTALVRNRGARLNASNPDVRSWAERGVTDAQLLTAFDLAEERRAAKGDPSPVNAGLLTVILRDVTAPQQARASPAARKANATRDQNREAIDRAKARIMAAEAGRSEMHDEGVINAH